MNGNKTALTTVHTIIERMRKKASDFQSDKCLKCVEAEGGWFDDDPTPTLSYREVDELSLLVCFAYFGISFFSFFLLHSFERLKKGRKISCDR